MRKLLFILPLVLQLIGCATMKSQKIESRNLTGLYERQKRTERLELKADGSYILMGPEILFTPIIEQSYYASKANGRLLHKMCLK